MDATVTYEQLPPAWPGVPVDAGGVTMFVRHAPATSADGESAVFVHGLGGGSASWTDLMELLRDRMDGYAPDLPGFGLSPPPPGRAYSVLAQAKAVVALIEHIAVPVHLFGNSLGGTVAVRVAADRPELVRTLTLVSPALPDLRPRPAIPALLLPLVPGLGAVVMRRAGRLSSEEQARQILHGLAGDPARVHPQRVAEAAAEIDAVAGNDHLQDAYLGALRGVVAAYLRRGHRGPWAAARRVQAPTLVVHGAADPMIDARLAARTARAIRGSRVLVLADVGHIAHLETPHLLARAFRALLPYQRTG